MPPVFSAALYIRVSLPASPDQVAARGAVQRIDAAAAVQDVVAAGAQQQVAAVGAVEDIVAAVANSDRHACLLSGWPAGKASPRAILVNRRRRPCLSRLHLRRFGTPLECAAHYGRRAPQSICITRSMPTFIGCVFPASRCALRRTSLLQSRCGRGAKRKPSEARSAKEGYFANS